jgi:hypothetical protein
MKLLSTAKIGRLVYNSRYGPVAVPSEYKIHEGSIVFRTYRTIFTEEDLSACPGCPIVSGANEVREPNGDRVNVGRRRATPGDEPWLSQLDHLSGPGQPRAATRRMA